MLSTGAMAIHAEAIHADNRDIGASRYRKNPLYGSAMRRVAFEQEGGDVETLTPISPMFAHAPRERGVAAP